MKKLKNLGMVSVVFGLIMMFPLQTISEELLDGWMVYDGDEWPHIWRLGGRLVIIGIGLLALAFYKEIPKDDADA